MAMLLSTAEVARLTGSTVRMIDHWARTGLLRPSGQEAAGKGSKRRYTFRDVVVLQAIRNLRQCNCPLQKIRKTIRYLQSHYPEETQADVLAKLTLLTDGQRVYMLTDERQLMDVSSRQLQISAWVVYVGKLILETTERLESLAQAWTERVIHGGKVFLFDVDRVPSPPGYVARCRELPGALRQAPTADQAVADLKRAVSAVLAHSGAHRQPRRVSRVGGRA